jgi:hypothetical protein
MEYLDTEREGEHGTEAFCDEPVTNHPARSIRRVQQHWPTDFDRAIVVFGNFRLAPRGGVNSRPWVEEWTFTVNVFAQEVITLDDGSIGGPPDIWAGEIYEQVRRRLGWFLPGIGGNVELPCDGDFAVINRKHLGTSVDLGFDTELRRWRIGGRFQWTIVVRGLLPPLCQPCEA